MQLEYDANHYKVYKERDSEFGLYDFPARYYISTMAGSCGPIPSKLLDRMIHSHARPHRALLPNSKSPTSTPRPRQRKGRRSAMQMS